MKLLRKLSIEYNAKTFEERKGLATPLPVTGRLVQTAFEAGFLSAKDLALKCEKREYGITTGLDGEKIYHLGEEEIQV